MDLREREQMEQASSQSRGLFAWRALPGQVPAQDRRIAARGEKCPAVLREGQGRYLARVATEAMPLLPRRHLPQPHRRVVVTDGRQRLAVRREREAFRLAFELEDHRAGGDVPDAHERVNGGDAVRREPLAVGTEG